MDNISFGDWIEVAGERPWWLRNGEPYQIGAEAPVFYSRTDPDYYWGGTTRMRVRADHPYYTAKPSTPSNEELTQRMEKLVRLVATWSQYADAEEGVNPGIQEARSIVSDLPKPVDPIVLEARAICQREINDELGETTGAFAKGELDGSLSMRCTIAALKSRTLAAGGTSHE